MSIQAVQGVEDILPVYRGTAVETFLRAHNLDQPYPQPAAPELILATCIDPRIVLHLPRGAAFITRSGGVRLDGEAMFKFTFLSMMLDIRAVIFMAHDDCAMEQIRGRREDFVARWQQRSKASEAEAEAFFDEHIDYWEALDVHHVVKQDAVRIRELCPDVVVAPLFYHVDTGKVSQLLD